MKNNSKPNSELIKELEQLQERHNSLKALYTKHLHQRKILQELTRESEEKLNEINALLEIAKEKTKIGGWVLYLETRQVYWSDGVTDIFEMPSGYEPQLEEAIGFFAPEWLDKITKAVTNCEQYGTPYDEEMEIITAKGKHTWIRVIGKANRNDDGIIVKLYGICQDITEQKIAEAEFHKLSMAVEQSPVSTYLTDAEGNIQYVNPKVIEITGYTSAELIGKNMKIFSAGQTSKSVYKKLWKTIAAGNEWRGELYNKSKNGELYWELASISPIINRKGNITNYVAVKEDITEQKQKEADLIEANEALTFQIKEKEKRAAELSDANEELAFQIKEKEKRAAELIVAKNRAEESDRLKSAFLANMSHEIRTPMNGILNFAQLLREPELSEEKKTKYFKIVEKSGARMLNIIDDIVDISKIESGLMNVHLEETNINKKIESIYNFFKPEAEAKGLQFSFKNRLHEKDEIINTDALKLYTILCNLVKNAIKFSHEGTIEYGYECIGDYLEFYIKDTGIGIPKDRQKAIFERFIQADIADKMVFEGAGLGLSIAKAYVEMLGGKIWVESEVGIGSTFYFTISCNPKIAQN